MGRKRKGRDISGILLLDKPPGRTSNSAMVVCRAIYNAAKAGHTGALDPLATGVLPVCFGEATKFSQYLLDADKAYRSTFVFGQQTNTADADGEVIAEADASDLTEALLNERIADFRGDIEQVPPMYSALKKDGRPLYELARKGIEIERQARPVTIYEYELEHFEPGVQAKAVVRVRCSKGTYIRSLAEDLGQQLGVGAHVATLRRIAAGPFTEQGVVSLDVLQQLRDAEDFAGLDTLLIPVEQALGHLPAIHLGDSAAHFLRQGQAVFHPGAGQSGTTTLFDHQGRFMGIGEILDDFRVKPRRLIANM
ncbi:tRNA pseudouridine(55) synthase TruB [Spongiibacter taiwanensis]|uniref:tRNA pseudouridine(55) synthase TruB n=1 Tax=Spongiibacter taiwanensis TaxID=1748242 RepID=UPI0020351186|nr:tRNA pseudouridine(55) synthase TruB [Spongiibacter taiwanensis]USA42416.1 tRNA pseudouridine(55) synthase TruB [Spongiibacter taiwanensis]